MKWCIDKSYPICPQICEQVCTAIYTGKIAPNSKLFSVRELALKLGVNPNTVQKSFDILEKQGIIYSIPSSGWYIKENIDVAKEVVTTLRFKKTNDYINEMKQLGCDYADILMYINERIGDR